MPKLSTPNFVLAIMCVSEVDDSHCYGDGHMIIDAHAHIYSTEENAYPPIAKPLRPPAGMGTVEQLQREMRDADVDRALLIQTYTFYGFDNRFIRDTSSNVKNWAGGVVNLDPAHPHSPDALHALAERSNIKAVRVSFEAYGYGVPGISLLYEEASRLGIPVNALLTLEHADRLEALLDTYPDLTVVLDHCLYLQAGSLFELTVEKVVELAKRPNVYAKLSFLAMGSADEYPFQDMHEACARFIEAYGPDRCIWGSCFPTELFCPKTTYEGQLRLFREELGLRPFELDDILGGTAERVYFGA